MEPAQFLRSKTK
jgi:hypothetical protein